MKKNGNWNDHSLRMAMGVVDSKMVMKAICNELGGTNHKFEESPLQCDNNQEMRHQKYTYTQGIRRIDNLHYKPAISWAPSYVNATQVGNNQDCKGMVNTLTN